MDDMVDVITEAELAEMEMSAALEDVGPNTYEANVIALVAEVRRLQGERNDAIDERNRFHERLDAICHGVGISGDVASCQCPEVAKRALEDYPTALQATHLTKLIEALGENTGTKHIANRLREIMGS